MRHKLDPPHHAGQPRGGCCATNASALQAHLSAQLRLGPAPPAGGSTIVTLAQRLGLVPSPPPPLTGEQWMQVHLQSRLRQDSAGDCAICLRPFRAEGQVLLSCSHTFHHQCLAAFERLSQQRCCPLCRCQAYQKRRIDDAERAWCHTCATRIQAAWRGRLARQQYRQLRRLLPPQHPVLKRRWCAEQLEESTAKLVSCVDQGTSDIDALFAELDATSAAAGAVFSALSSRCPTSGTTTSALEATTLGSGQGAQAEPAPASGASPAAESSGAAQTVPAQQPPAAQADAGIDWDAVVCRCLQRDEQPECAICLAPLGQQWCSSSMPSAAASAAAGAGQLAGAGSSSSGRSRQECAGRITSSSFSRRSNGTSPCHEASQRQHRGTNNSRPSAGSGTSGSSAGTGGGGIAVLSCSHAFHADCLSALEAFSLASDLAAACPCCRSSYCRLDL